MKKMRGKMQMGGKKPRGIYNLDGSFSPGYYDRRTDSWVSEGDTIPVTNSMSFASPALKETAPIQQIPAMENPVWTNYRPITGNPKPPTNPYSQEAMDADNNQALQDLANIPGNETQYFQTGFENGQPKSYNANNINQDQAHIEANMTAAGAGPGTNHPIQKPKSTVNPYTSIFFGLRGAQMAAAFLAEKKRNANMADYDYKQQTALGLMNPMPVSAFQYSNFDHTTPNRMYAQQGGTMNPYLYHAKYGGNLKSILREYGKWSNDAGPMDMTDGMPGYDINKKKGGFALDEMVVRDFLSKLMEFGNGPHPYSGMHTKRAQEGGQINNDMTQLRRGGNPAKRRMGRQQPQQQSGQQAQIMQLIQMYAQMTGNSPQKIMQQLKQMQPQQQQAALQQMAQAVQQAQSGQGQGQQQGQMQQQPQQGQMMQGDTDQDQMQRGGYQIAPTYSDNTHIPLPIVMDLDKIKKANSQMALLRGKNTVVAIPGGSTIPGDSTRYMTGRENQFGVPYVIDQIGVKGYSENTAKDFLNLPANKMRIYQDSTLGNVNGFYKEGGNWIQGAVNPAHKGWCTPLSNPHCTGRRRQFALMMKKNHGFHG